VDLKSVRLQLLQFWRWSTTNQTFIVFRAKGVGIAQKEKAQWNKRVVVDFQTNAWVDETILIGAQYITEQEAAEATETQIRLETAAARGLGLGEEIVE